VEIILGVSLYLMKDTVFLCRTKKTDYVGHYFDCN
jgi:hypothetical protein